MHPNILICGTPGTGKSTLCEELNSRLQPNSSFHKVSDICNENNYYDGYDEKLETHILDEDKLLDDLEVKLGDERDDTITNIVEYHHSELFPERWFHLVVVLRTENSILFDRLTARGYNDAKRENNLQCEMYGVLAEEARESYPKIEVVELRNDSVEDLESNVEQIAAFVENFVKSN